MAERLRILDESGLFNALDLPPEAHAIQDAYWKAEREWQETKEAFEIVLRVVLDQLGKQ